ncbi:MAG: glutamate-1-semialdehyde 2,1-aminomutase [Candidatus Omnitrophota bacterium]|jgi:glutamate-1-semialdehyde 2,1-aminomutase
MKKTTRSSVLFKQASKYLVGGVNSPVRSFMAVGGTPLFIKRAQGCRVYDEDSNSYIDYVMSWGALILGHLHPKVISAARAALGSGTGFGAPTENETKLARVICNTIPSIEMLRLVNSGTEATMSAIRLARGFTGKNKIIKFEGSYHGHVDSLLVKSGSGCATFGIPDSLGVTRSLSKDTIVVPFNNIDGIGELIKRKHKEIACVIVEPVCANMGIVLPKNNFLSDLRELTARHKIILIFDEVVSGFRLTFGGAQKLYGIEPDLTCLGKIIGGGLPIGAYGGRREIMECVSPLGRVYQAGTLSGNPIAVSAGLETLELLSGLDYTMLNRNAEKLCRGLEDILLVKKVDFKLNRAGSMFTLFFTKHKVDNFSSAQSSDTKKYARYFWNMLKEGINLAPSQFEANFVSFAHQDNDVKKTLAAHKKAVFKENDGTL